MEKRYTITSTEQIKKRMRAFNQYYALLREFIEKGTLKSSLDRGAFTHPRQILNKDIIDSLGAKRHRISLGYGPEAGEDLLRKNIAYLENLKHKTHYNLDNIAIVAGAWFGVELAIEEINRTRRDKAKKLRIAVIGPTHYQLFQRPVEILNAEVIGFDFINFKGSTPKTKEEINDILKWKPNIVFVTNPNNPVGEYFPSKLLQYLIKKCKNKNTYILIDEMQNFLPTKEKGLNYAKWIQSKKVVRIDSFSKHYGLAEYRVGWVIADKEFIGNRYNGIIGQTRGLMGNAPRAANNAILKLIDIETATIKGGRNILQKQLKSIERKEQFLIDYLSKDPRIEIIHRDACYNIVIKVKGVKNDIEFSRRLMEAGTMLMPCEGYGYRSQDVVMRITFAERWKKIIHGMKTLTSVLNNLDK